MSKFFPFITHTLNLEINDAAKVEVEIFLYLQLDKITYALLNTTPMS